MSLENDLLSYDINDLIKITQKFDAKKFVAQQIFDWLHKKNIFDFNLMNNISNNLKIKISKEYFISRPNIIKINEESDSKKFLIELHDKNFVECMIASYSFGNTLCVSSQIGCKMGCLFCESGKNNFIRNLNVGEICSQVYLINKIKKISRIVIMGIGEPLDNYKNILKFIKIISSPNGFNLSQRNITLSTCGLIEKIKKISNEKLKINLAVSLHASNDLIRNKIMKISKLNKLDEIIKSCVDYYKSTGRRITFEYLLLKDINDKKNYAEELSRKIKKMPCHVNILKFNKITNCPYKPSDELTQREFINTLKKNKINVTVRRSIGNNINAACGQLKNNFTKIKNQI
jgi:23S rRNA (adenine2503-C2)-methyltransferase